MRTNVTCNTMFLTIWFQFTSVLENFECLWFLKSNHNQMVSWIASNASAPTGTSISTWLSICSRTFENYRISCSSSCTMKLCILLGTLGRSFSIDPINAYWNKPKLLFQLRMSKILILIYYITLRLKYSREIKISETFQRGFDPSSKISDNWFLL